MILWLLRRFAAFRELEVANRGLRRKLIAAKKESEALRNSAALIEKLDEARTSEIESTRLVADQFSFMRFGRTVYNRGEAVQPIRPEDHQPIAKSKLQASDVVRIKTQEFKEAMLERERKQNAAAADFFDAELAQRAKEQTA